MKILTTLTAVLLYSLFWAQQTDNTKLQQLMAPTSPASAITGMQPATVLTPKTYNALETALYNNFTNDGNLILPKDLGIEFTPYWTKNHGLSLGDYLYPSIGQSLLMNTAFSLASSQSYKLGDSSQSNVLGVGIRSSIFFSNKQDRDTVDNYTKQLHTFDKIESKIGGIVSILINADTITSNQRLLTAVEPILKRYLLSYGYTTSDEEASKTAHAICSDTTALPAFVQGTASVTNSLREAFLQSMRNHLYADATFEHFQQYLQHRNGFCFDIALASLVSFPTNSFEFSYVPKTALWLTPSYSFWNNENHGLKVLLVYRFEHYNMDFYRNYFPNSTVYNNNHDYGLSLLADFRKCSVQMEVVGRSNRSEIPVGTDAQNNTLYVIKKNQDLQYMLTLNYRLTPQAVLTYRIGNQFDPILNPKSTLISNLSVNFGFGAPDKHSLSLTRKL